MIWFIIPAIKLSKSRSTYNALQLIVLIQYIPRVYLIFPLNSEIVKANGVVTKTAWAGAAYNLLLYMLASHVRSYYLFSHLLIHLYEVVILKFFSFFGVGLGGGMVSAVSRKILIMLEINMQK